MELTDAGELDFLPGFEERSARLKECVAKVLGLAAASPESHDKQCRKLRIGDRPGSCGIA